ncbi:MAG: VOC family protein [Parasphingopyxis sp.]|uniref:VOC family protein n=1 Tax=Parasphingopyxis sp. TaxID=1920299 RepID=UPI0032EEEBBD
MSLKLAYCGIEASDLNAWRQYGELLGLQPGGDGDALFFRMDDYSRRLIVREGPADDLVFAGFEAGNEDDFAAALARLEKAGVEFNDGSDDGAALRGVDRYVGFFDPEGIRHEICIGCKKAENPFHSEYVTDGFETGDGGMGHIAANCTDYEACEGFLKKALGARLSDHIFSPFGDSEVRATFLHLNERHHSVAYAQFPVKAPKKIDHIMVELREIKDVLRAQERVIDAGIPITISLGEHPNDHAVSFYCTSPSGFRIELAANCIKVEPESWEPTTYDHFSEWGHRVANG